MPSVTKAFVHGFLDVLAGCVVISRVHRQFALDSIFDESLSFFLKLLLHVSLDGEQLGHLPLLKPFVVKFSFALHNLKFINQTNFFGVLGFWGFGV